MKFDVSQLHESVPPEEIGGFVRAALVDQQKPFVHVAGAGLAARREAEENRQCAIRLSRPIGELVACGDQNGSLIEEIGVGDIGYSFHTDHPYLDRPERFVGLFAVQVASGVRIHLLDALDFIRWAVHNREDAKVVEEIRSKPVIFRGEGLRLERPVLNASLMFRFSPPAISTRDPQWAGNVDKVFRQASQVARSVKLQQGDALFFNNHTQLHRVAPGAEEADSRVLLRTRMQGNTPSYLRSRAKRQP